MEQCKFKNPFSPFIKWFKDRTNTERIVWICLLHGFIWVDCSYLLAWFHRSDIAENLSQVAITEIIGVVLIYAIKEGVANLSKNNNWPDKPENKTKNDEEGRTI